MEEKQPTLEEIKEKQRNKEIEEMQSRKYQKLAKKWGFNLEEMKQQDNSVDEKALLETEINRLLEEKRNRKMTKFQQIQKAMNDKQIEEQCMKKSIFDASTPTPPDLYHDLMHKRKDVVAPINVGQGLVNTIQQVEKKRLGYYADASTNFFWMNIRRGRLGVDLFAIAFGLVGMFVLPTYFYKKHMRRRKLYEDRIKISSTVEDWEESLIDIDDVSSEHSNYNLFSEEIEEITKKQMQVSQEIKDLINKLYN